MPAAIAAAARAKSEGARRASRCMAESRVETFAAAARAAHAEVTRTDAAGATAAIEAAVEPPAVGTPLPFDGVALPDGVETDLSPSAVEGAATGVTAAGLAVAAYGSVVVDSTAAGEEPASLFVGRHVAVLAASDVVDDLSAAVGRLAERAAAGRDAVVATGPSATADMGELVYGAHGPRSVHVVVLEDR